MKNSTAGLPSWQALLDYAIELLEEPRFVESRIECSLGAATILFLHYAHRESRDIDIFLHDAQALPHLSSRHASSAGELRPRRACARSG